VQHFNCILNTQEICEVNSNMCVMCIGKLSFMHFYFTVG